MSDAKPPSSSIDSERRMRRCVFESRFVCCNLSKSSSYSVRVVPNSENVNLSVVSFFTPLLCSRSMSSLSSSAYVSHVPASFFHCHTPSFSFSPLLALAVVAFVVLLSSPSSSSFDFVFLVAAAVEKFVVSLIYHSSALQISVF